MPVVFSFAMLKKSTLHSLDTNHRNDEINIDNTLKSKEYKKKFFQLMVIKSRKYQSTYLTSGYTHVSRFICRVDRRMMIASCQSSNN